MTAPAKNETTAVAKRADKELTLGMLPPEVRQHLAFRKIQAQLASTIASQNWGNKLDYATQMAIASWCYERDVDPATEVDVLGGRPYRNAYWWLRKLAELSQEGLVEYAYADHINHDDRLASLAKMGDESAAAESSRRTRERIKYNAPDKAVAAVAFHIRLRGMSEDTVGCKWTGGGTRKNDPVGDAVPVETAETRAARRACRLLVSYLPSEKRQAFDAVAADEGELGDEIRASKKRLADKMARLKSPGMGTQKVVQIQPGLNFVVDDGTPLAKVPESEYGGERPSAGNVAPMDDADDDYRDDEQRLADDDA